MKKASGYAFIGRNKRAQNETLPSSQVVNGFGGLILPKNDQDLNVFVVTFDGMKNAEQNLSGGDPYQCKKCKAVLNKYSKVYTARQYEQLKKEMNIELKQNQSFWECQFCLYPNILRIEEQEIPKKDDVVYMIESAHQNQVTENDQTIVFCIDTSGSMNTTSQIQGKVQLKFGLSTQQIQMLKQFMQPGDQQQFNFIPGQQQNKTFISRKQCILSAIQSQLSSLSKSNPLKKVGFITFNSQVTIMGQKPEQTVNILGDRLYKKELILDMLKQFKLNVPLGEAYQDLIKNLDKVEAKGKTALGPGLLAAIELASKGSPGSMVVLCTDGLANIGVGSLDPTQQASTKFYKELAELAKARNVIINLITIKGQNAKMDIIGQLAQDTNGNIKVVNPEKLKDDFANVLKDEVVGLNVQAKIMLHKAMTFRNQNQQFLKDNKTVLVKDFANATVNTRVSFQYEIRQQEDLKFMQIDVQKLKTVPFQAQIIYTSPKGGKFLRVISSQSKTTTQKQELKKDANIGVVHQRIASNTAALFSQGSIQKAQNYNAQWSNYLNEQFVEQKQQKQNQHFNMKNKRLNNAIEKKSMRGMQQEISQNSFSSKPVRIQEKSVGFLEKCKNSFLSKLSEVKEQKMEQSNFKELQKGKIKIQEEKPQKRERRKSICKSDSDSMNEDQEDQELMENMMEKQCYDLD